MCTQERLAIHTKKAKNMHTNTRRGSRWDCSSSSRRSSSSVQLSSFNAPPLITSPRRREEQLLRRMIYGGSRRLRADPFGSQRRGSGQLATKPASGLRTGQGLLQMRRREKEGGGGGGEAWLPGWHRVRKRSGRPAEGVGPLRAPLPASCVRAIWGASSR